MTVTGKLVEMADGRSAVLRDRISWAARCRIEDAGGLPPEVASIYAEFADLGLSEAELAKAVAPRIVPYMAALGGFTRAKQSAQVLAWVESWDFGEVTVETLGEMDEDDALVLIEAVGTREALAVKARDASADGADDALSPTPAAAPSGSPSMDVAAIPAN